EEWTRARAAKRRHVGARAQRTAEIGAHDPNVGALAAGDANSGSGVAEFQQLQRVDHDLARLALDFQAGARQLVQTLAGHAYGRIHRRALELRTEQARQGGTHRAFAQAARVRRRGDFAFRVERVGFDTETHGSFVFLVGTLEKCRQLG